MKRVTCENFQPHKVADKINFIDFILLLLYENATSQANCLLSQHARIKFGEPTIDFKSKQKHSGASVQWINFHRLVYVCLLTDKMGRIETNVCALMFALF